MLKQVNFSIFICTFVQSEYKNSQNYPNHEIILRNNHTSEAEILRLMPENPETGRLTVACAPADYSASIIARAVEDVDAHLLNLNVTADSDAARVVTDLRVSHRNVGAVARSLMRYGYEILSADAPRAPPGPDSPDDTNPYAALIRYLDI